MSNGEMMEELNIDSGSESSQDLELTPLNASMIKSEKINELLCKQSISSRYASDLRSLLTKMPRDVVNELANETIDVSDDLIHRAFDSMVSREFEGIEFDNDFANESDEALLKKQREQASSQSFSPTDNW